MSFFNHHHITSQPEANPDLGSLDLKQISVQEKNFDSDASLENGHHHDHRCEHGHTTTTSSSEHDSCHNVRLRRFLIPAILVFIAFGGFLVWSCASGMPAWSGDLMRRALGDGSTSNESSFTKHKRQWAPLHT